MAGTKRIDRSQVVKNLQKQFGGPAGVLGHMILTLSISGQKCDVAFRKRAPALDVKIDERISLALMYGAGAKKLQEMLQSIRLSNGDVASLNEIWMVLPMPNGGISEAELAAVDLADGEEKWGLQGETVREMIRNIYHCKTQQEEERFLRRYLAS
jgi:hypothetical protein